MSNWITITIATLYEAKVAALIDAADSRALKAGQPNRSAGIIQGVVDEIRRKVASNKQNQVDASLTTIPKGLRDMAVDMIVARLKISIEKDLSEDERRQLDTHKLNLNRIADGKDVVDQPDNPVEAQIEGAPDVVVVRPGQKIGGRNFEGGRHPFSEV
ncbi:MAG TPA: hypothetical protein VHY30_01550 [Verrucomicrobiae bacterium]|jgi:hypothetical protein|nr:hypothetical protein [Verrucomicrobiae bacterium]